MQLTSSVLLLALGASSVSAAAYPKHQRHQKFHEKKAVGDIVHAVIDGVDVSWVNTYDGGSPNAPESSGVSPPAAATPAAAAAPAAAPASSPVVAAEGASSSSGKSAGNSQSLSSFKAFCPPSKIESKVKRATTDQIGYVGNVGSVWGCNFQLVDSSIADQYDYTMNFNSASSKDQQCVCWNKIGKQGGLTGFFGQAAVTFNVPAGSSQTVAVDADTQGGCSCAPGEVPKNSIGAWSATWLEFDMANESNRKYSGADISALMPQQYGDFVQGMKVCATAQGQCSSLHDNAANVKAAYVTGMEADDGVGINLAPGKVVLDVTIDYSG